VNQGSIPTLRVIVIGKGVWGKKVQSVISENSNRSVKLISARSVLSGKQLIPKNLQKDCIIWIATCPELQIKLVSKVSDFEKIIIEKPIANSSKQFTELKNELAKVKCKVFISEVWSHSLFWETLISKIKLESHNIRRIIVTRYGEAAHSYIHPPLDWLAHDINLLYRLSNSLGSRIKVRNVNWDEAGQLLSIDADLPSYFSVKLKGGESVRGREAIWNLYGDNGLIVSANFLDDSFSTEEGSFNPKIQKSVEHPIISYLNCVEASDHCRAEMDQIDLHGLILRKE